MATALVTSCCLVSIHVIVFNKKSLCLCMTLQSFIYYAGCTDNSEMEDAELMNKIAMIDKLLQSNHESPDSKV